MLRFAGGARGMVWASQVAPGNENGLRLRIYGDKGGIEWGQENPNVMTYAPSASRNSFSPVVVPAWAAARANNWTRIPPGHPEGYLEGFATLYNDAADLIQGKSDGSLLPGSTQGWTACGSSTPASTPPVRMADG